jgi:hypothetical protein
MYLTDGTFLYRVVGLTAGRDGGTVELEDCYGLDVVHVKVRDLTTRGLRAVMPLGTPDIDPVEAGSSSAAHSGSVPGAARASLRS